MPVMARWAGPWPAVPAGYSPICWHPSGRRSAPRGWTSSATASTRRPASMPIRRLHTETRYSEAVIHNGAVYLSGQLADDLDGDIRQQTRETLASIERLLEEAGTSKARLLSATIHLKDIAGDY